MGLNKKLTDIQTSLIVCFNNPPSLSYTLLSYSHTLNRKYSLPLLVRCTVSLIIHDVGFFLAGSSSADRMRP
jgi:hypothetical protein